ncbi:hypothetical protein [Acuticoccus mangrovi]|uniref:Uncharacterized protein n=1 Tax=Acuticoccus mangrovi TaxID=2796142 RepID=A0A934MFU3_9HYPH|nr:hypothetical protein [Acuticoccus mangrovi]MBJ3775300.1 hypothetical protein [Acuticoccus mangrovi]
MAHEPEAELEGFALALLDELGVPHAHGSAFAPESANAPRGSWRETILRPRLKAAVEHLSPHLSPSARRDTVAKVADSVFPDPIAENATKSFS